MNRSRFLSGCVITVALVLVVANLLLSSAIFLMARDGYWLEEAVSKAMLLRAGPVSPDIVVVGSSKVENHLDTFLLGELGIDVFNFGLPGRGVADYFYPVEQALEAGARQVILSVSGSNLQLKGREPEDRLLANIVGYGEAMQSTVGFRQILEGLWSKIPIVRYPTFLKHFVEGRRKFLRELEIPEICGDGIDVERISYVRGARGRQFLVLKGGDSAMCRVLSREMRFSTGELTQLHPNKKAIVSALVNRIHAAGGEAYLLLQPPAPGKIVDVDARMLRRETGADGIIDLGRVGENRGDWGDIRHLNVRGRREFTLKFAERWKLLHREHGELPRR